MGVALADRAIRVRLVIGAYTNLQAQYDLADELERNLGCQDTVKTKVKLVPDEYIGPLRAHQTAIRALQARYCLRFGDGWVLPTGLFDQFMVQYDQAKEAFEQARSNLKANYQKLLDDVERRSGKLRLHERLPSDPDYFVCQFYVTLYIEPLGDPTTWQSKMPPMVVAEIQQNFSNFISEASKDAVGDALNRMESALAHLVNKLQEPESIFKEATVAKVRELIDLLPHFNIIDDPGINRLHQQLASTLLNADAETLRNNPDVRTETVQSARSAIDSIQILKDTLNVPIA